MTRVSVAAGERVHGCSACGPRSTISIASSTRPTRRPAMRAKAEVLAHAQVGVQRGLLGDVADSPAQLRRAGRQAEHGRGSGLDHLHAHDCAHERGLARAARPQQAGQIHADLDRDSRQDGGTAAPHLQVADDDRGGGRAHDTNLHEILDLRTRPSDTRPVGGRGAEGSRRRRSRCSAWPRRAPHRGSGPGSRTGGAYADPAEFYPALGELGVQVLRVHLNWGGKLGVAKRRPVEGTDVDDPAYDWRLYDRVVLDARRHGVEVLFTIFGTPPWANGGAAGRARRATRRGCASSPMRRRRATAATSVVTASSCRVSVSGLRGTSRTCRSAWCRSGAASAGAG